MMIYSIRTFNSCLPNKTTVNSRVLINRFTDLGTCVGTRHTMRFRASVCVCRTRVLYSRPRVTTQREWYITFTRTTCVSYLRFVPVTFAAAAVKTVFPRVSPSADARAEAGRQMGPRVANSLPPSSSRSGRKDAMDRAGDVGGGRRGFRKGSEDG